MNRPRPRNWPDPGLSSINRDLTTMILQSCTLWWEVFMSLRSVPMTSVLTCLLAAVSIASIGCSSMNSNPNRVLQSMVISPANADAQTSPSGQVQFSAMGTFSKAPSPAPVPFAVPYTGTSPTPDTNVARRTQAALPTCASAATGTVIINAMASTTSATG